MSKGSKRRPRQIKEQTFKDNWDKIFGSKKKKESINKLKDDVKSINKKDLLQIQGDVSGLTEQINEFVEIEVPKYKSFDV